MGLIAVKKSFLSKSLFFALSISISLAFGNAAWADNNATLSKLEKWLFFATFSSESDEDRIKRIEEKTFGEPAEGALDARLSKLDDMLSQRQKEKDEQEQAQKAPASSSSHNTTSNAAHNFGSSPQGQAAGSVSRPSSSSALDSASDAEAAKERQRIAVQAAREQEMHDLLENGASLWRSRHGEQAVETFNQVLRLDPQNPDAHFSIGVIQEALGKLKDAKAHYEIAAQTNPDNKDYKDAVAAVSKKLQAAPTDPNRALAEKANAAFKRGEYISAVNLFKELEEKSPKQASVKYSLGTTYLMLKDHFNALEYFKLAHQLEPNNTKYASAFNDLSSEMAKHQQALTGIENKYQAAGLNQAGLQSPSVAPSKKNKDKKGKTQQTSVPSGSQYQGQPPMQQQQYYPNQSPGFQQQQQQQMPAQQMMQPPMQQQMMQQPMPQQMMQPPMQQQMMRQPMQQPMMQQPMMQQAMSQMQRPIQYGAPANQFASSYQNQQGTYIPPDPQQYATPQPIPQQMQQQMPQQMPQQMQQQLPMSQQSYGNKYPNQQPGAETGAQQGGVEKPYIPPPEHAPKGRYDPRIAAQLNAQVAGTKSAKSDPMTNYGITGHASNEGILITGIRGGSRAARAGLQKGDIIRTVDGNEVMQPGQLNQTFSQYDSSQTLPILIFRDGNITPIQF